MAKLILFRDEGRRKILSGVEQLSAAVKVTLGPKGRNAVLDKKFGSPTITKDGVTQIAQAHFPNREEDHQKDHHAPYNHQYSR